MMSNQRSHYDIKNIVFVLELITFGTVYLQKLSLHQHLILLKMDSTIGCNKKWSINGHLNYEEPGVEVTYIGVS